MHLIRPIPDAMAERPEFTAFYERLKSAFWATTCVPARSTPPAKYPPEVVDGLKRLGAFGMKIPTEYGGLGFSQVEYGRVMELLRQLRRQHLGAALGAPVDRRAAAASRSSARPEQKGRFLPRCAAGAISAFALTEDGVGSDPAQLATTAELTPDGDGLRHQRREALVHQRHDRRAARRHGPPPEFEEDQRVRRRGRRRPASRSCTAAASWG